MLTFICFVSCSNDQDINLPSFSISAEIPKKIYQKCYFANVFTFERALPNLRVQDVLLQFSESTDPCKWFDGYKTCQKLTPSEPALRANLNFCIANQSTILLGESFHILFEQSPGILSEFSVQYRQLKENRAGRQRAALNEQRWFDFLNEKIGLFWQPDDSAFSYLKQQAETANSIWVHADTDLSDKSYFFSQDVLGKVQKLKTSTESRRRISRSMHDKFMFILDEVDALPWQGFCLDCESKLGKWYWFSGKPGKHNDYNDNHVMVIFSVNHLPIPVSAKSNTIFKQPAQTAQPGDVLISEMLWQGSISDENKKNGLDEFIEIKNQTGNRVTIDSWQFYCKNSKGKKGRRLIFPVGEILKPYETYTVKKLCRSNLFQSNWCSNRLSIANNSTECRLENHNGVIIHSWQSLELKKETDIYRSLQLADISNPFEYKYKATKENQNTLNNGYRSHTIASPNTVP